MLVLIYKNNLDHLLKKRFYMIIGCCLYGIIACGCRTNMLCCLIGVFVYVLFAFDLKKRTKYFAVCSLLGIILFSSIPFLQEKANEILSIFDTNSSMSGSSIGMRVLQYTAVMNHVRDQCCPKRFIGTMNMRLL